jgi:radical SAM-linked protein
MVRQRVRIRFRKQGDLRLIGHRDLVRTLERLFRRAGVRLAMSEGFHPKLKLSFPSALAVGIAGSEEVMELELAESCRGDELLGRLAPHAPPGLTLDRIDPVPPGTPKGRLRTVTYQVPIPPQHRVEAARQVARLLAAETCTIHRPRRSEPLDLRGFLESLELRGDVLEFRLRASHGASPGPRDVLGALGLADLEQDGIQITRSQVELET